MKIKRKSILIVLALVLMIELIIVGVMKNKSDDSSSKIGVSNETSIEAEKIEMGETYIPVGDGFSIVGIGAYNGAYVEDGSDEYVDNVMMVVIENKGERNIQLAEFNINGKYEFELTTLLPQETIIVLEKNRQEYSPDLTITSTELESFAVFEEKPSMHEEYLEISGDDSLLTINNVSNKDFPGGKVFYKNVADGKLLGGITYSAAIPELKAGQGIKMSVNHYMKEFSELIFVTYAE